MEEENGADYKSLLHKTDLGWLDVPPFEVCNICGEHVQINNDDVESSMELHVQSHKSILAINNQFDKQVKEFLIYSRNERTIHTYSGCKTNDDTNVSFVPYIHKNKSAGGDVLSDDDRLSTTSSTSKHSERKVNYSKTEQDSYCGQTALLDRLFDIMPIGLKSHRSFISENENNTFCKICNMKIRPVFSVSEHLKTKIHEDNTINFLKQKLPSSLHEMMDFISFYGSNLCCNLCRTQINLSSNNPHETIVNIMVHNASSDHLDKKTNSKPSGKADDALLILKTFASLNSVIKDNKHLIECNMQPTFKCKLCNKPIEYDNNEYELLKNFIDHLNSIDHNRLLKSRSIINTFNASHLSANEEHNFVATKHGICCTVCNCVLAESLEQLVSHAKGSNYNTNCNNPSSFSTVKVNYNEDIAIAEMPSPCLNEYLTTGNETFNMKVSPTEIKLQESVAKQVLDLQSLLNSLPEHLKSTSCIVENEEGHLSCSVCQCQIPPTAYNIETHLTGNKHKNKKDVLEIEQVLKKLPLHLQKNYIYIKNYTNEFNRLTCTLCNVKIPIHINCLQEHLEGENHTDLVRQTKSVHENVKCEEVLFEDVLLNNILKTEVGLKNHMKYLNMKDDHYMCNLCKKTILRPYDEELFKTNLFEHFGGPKHKSNVVKLVDNILGKLKFSDPIIKKNKTYLKRRDFQIYCTICECAMSPPTDEEGLKKILSSHLTGSRHMNNKAKTSLAAPTGAYFGSVVNSNDSIGEYFKMLPVEFQGDIIHMKKGSVDGYLSCTLCCCIINPHFLKEHLEGDRHVKEKALQHQPDT